MDPAGVGGRVSPFSAADLAVHAARAALTQAGVAILGVLTPLASAADRLGVRKAA